MYRNFFSSPWSLPKFLLSKPRLIYLDMGSSCNCRCKQCDLWKINAGSEQSLSIAQGKKVIDKLWSWLGSNFYLTFTGGEPLLHKDKLFQLIKFASSKGIKTSLVSNGTLINQKTAKELINSGVSNVIISLDGIEEKTHDYLRGVKGVGGKAKKAICLLNELRINQTPKIDLKINTIPMKQNLAELPKIVAWAKKIGVDGVSFSALSSKASFGNKIYNPSWWHDYFLWPDYKKLAKTVDKLILMGKKGFPLLNEMSYLENCKKYYKNPIDFGKENVPCRLTQNQHLFIGVNGSVRLCLKYPSLGNILIKNIHQIWQSEEAKKQRDLIKICPRECKFF